MLTDGEPSLGLGTVAIPRLISKTAGGHITDNVNVLPALTDITTGLELYYPFNERAGTTTAELSIAL